MLTPGQHALSREEAMLLLTELSDVQARLDHLVDGLRRLLDRAEGAWASSSFGRPAMVASMGVGHHEPAGERCLAGPSCRRR
jgi:hypothetical protein